jgi:uncharacterized SAM-binding protein YcdF (DUF218 family)
MPFKSLIKFLIDPFAIFWLLLLIILGAWFFKKRRLLRWLVMISALWFLIISTPFVPTLVLNSLESRFTPIYIKEISNIEAEYHIIILGGGHGFDSRLPANSLLSRTALGRLNEGIRLHRQLPNSRLVLSGYSSSGRTTQAEMMRQTALLLGVKEKATILQNAPENTREEVEIYVENYGNTYPVILVTDAAHMPRAMRTFVHQGIEPLASPTNYRLRGSWKRKWIGLPSTGNIENLRMGIYEYVGMLWYDLKY